ncbi:MAG: DUF1576 domain-containing protein [Rectinemataceae bacterium]
MATIDRSLYRIVGLTILAFLVFGLMAEGPGPALAGFLRLQTAPSRLLTDFAAVAGPGAAMFNAGVVGSLGLFYLRLHKIRLSGPTLAAVFIMAGFGLFGKTLLNCIPILLGVELAAKVAGKPPSGYVLIGMFGTSLGPMVSFLAFETGLPPFAAFALSIAGGIAAGLLLPALGIAMLHLHQGYVLYNIGLTAGFLALFAAGIIEAAGGKLPLSWELYEGHDVFMTWLVPALAAGLIIAAYALGKGKTLRDFLAVQKLSGRLPSDFIELVSLPGTLLNMGVVGLIGYVYVRAIGGTVSGPILGALITMMGFAAFGKTVRNILPVMAGALIATLVFGMDPASADALMIILFCTGLAPLAGEFGPGVGMVAGFLHFVMADRTALWHGGMALYNNGFAAGLTAALIVAVIEWYRSSRID